VARVIGLLAFLRDGRLIRGLAPLADLLCGDAASRKRNGKCEYAHGRSAVRGTGEA
jgi:hypothetical protein